MILVVHTPLVHEEVSVLHPIHRRHQTARTRRGIRAWWHEHISRPLDEMYEHLDEHQQDDAL